MSCWEKVDKTRRICQVGCHRRVQPFASFIKIGHDVRGAHYGSTLSVEANKTITRSTKASQDRIEGAYVSSRIRKMLRAYQRLLLVAQSSLAFMYYRIIYGFPTALLT